MRIMSLMSLYIISFIKQVETVRNSNCLQIFSNVDDMKEMLNSAVHLLSHFLAN